MIQIVYSTFPDLASAKVIIKLLLDARLIACANIYASESMYMWQGKLEDTPEFVAYIKTKAANARAVRELIANKHPYDVPCILDWPAGGNAPYQKWVSEQVDG